MCEQFCHTASECPYVYSICKAQKCNGIRKLLTSHTSRNPDRKFLICQYQACGNFQWLDDAIKESKLQVSTSTKSCFNCGEMGHWYKSCPWDDCLCNNPSCGGTRKLLTSKKQVSIGQKFLKCPVCGSFEWLVDAIRGVEPTITIEMTIKDLCKLSIN